MKCVLLIYLFIFMCELNAQNELTGIITDGTNGLPMTYATVVLLLPDSSVVAGITTKDDGRFVFSNIENGFYILQLSFVGYDRLSITVDVPVQSNLGEIVLNESANSIREVFVTAQRPFVEHRLDKTIVNVSGNIITAGLSINELLNEIPGLWVRDDGRVMLNGRMATVHIDGRPTRLPAVQVAQLLNGMQGDLVDRIELISNPSARYEAGMSPSIINIRLKRDLTLGTNGSVMTNVGFTEYDFIYRNGVNFNYRSKRINVFGNYGFNHNVTRQDIHQIRKYSTTPSMLYDQRSMVKSVNPGHTLRTGVDWFISPKHTFGFLFTGMYSGSVRATVTSETNISNIDEFLPDSTTLSNIGILLDGNSKMYNLNYRLMIDDLGSELTADADYGNVYIKNKQNMQTRYFDSFGEEQRLQTAFQHTVPQDINILSFKLDLSKFFTSETKIETGLKVNQTITDNEIKYENFVNNSWEPDYNQSNRFRYREQIFAGYASYGFQLNKISTMLGVRAEYTQMWGESFTMDTTFNRSYLELFPSIFYQYRVNNNTSVNFSYSRRLQRPGYSLLNPFRTYIDPYTYTSGNPDLKPMFTHSIEFKLDGGHLSITSGYNITYGAFGQEIKQDDQQRITSYTYENIGKRQVFSLIPFGRFVFSPKYTLRVGPSVFWNVDNSWYNKEPFDKNYLTMQLRIYNSFTFSPLFGGTFSFMWQDEGWDGINKVDRRNLWQANINVRYLFFDRRLNVAFNCNDIFSSYRYKTTGKFQNIDQTTVEVGHGRTIRISATYNFGSNQIRGARNRAVGIEEEMSRAQ